MLLPTFLQKHPFRKKCTEFSSCNEHIRNTQNFYSFLHNLWLIYLKCWNTIRFLNCYKGIVHPKIKICHTHPWVVPNLFEFLSSVDMLKDVGNQTVNSTHCLPNFFFPTMEVNGYHQLFDYQQSSTYQKKKDTLKILISWLNSTDLSKLVPSI